MPNGDSTPDVSKILADDNFRSLPLPEKHKVLLKVDLNYAGLPPREQAHAMTVIQYGPEPKTEDMGGGSPWIRGIYGIGRGLNNAVEATYQTIFHPIKTASAIATQIEDVPKNIREANKEPSTIGKVAGYGAAVPVLGPFGKQLGERAAKGDVAGAVTEGITTVAAPSIAKEATRAISKNVPRPSIKLKEKFNVGPFEINRNVPPPPEPPPTPEDVAYQTGKLQTEAKAQDVKETTRISKSREAAFNKEAEERMAIQKRADDAEAARVEAEKVAKNNRLKADAAHTKELADAEKARQAEITAQAKVRQIQAQLDESARTQREAAGKRQFKADAAQEKFYQDQQDSLKAQMKQAEKEASDAAAQKERLRTQHGDDLMRRQKEQDALDRAASKAADEESTAKGVVRRLPPERPGSSGVRPTPAERLLTNLVKKNIWTPDDLRDIRTQLGKDALPSRGEAPVAWRARVLGLLRSGRAARGMRDVSSGPSITPPPSP